MVQNVCHYCSWFQTSSKISRACTIRFGGGTLGKAENAPLLGYMDVSGFPITQLDKVFQTTMFPVEYFIFFQTHELS